MACLFIFQQIIHKFNCTFTIFIFLLFLHLSCLITLYKWIYVYFLDSLLSLLLNYICDIRYLSYIVFIDHIIWDIQYSSKKIVFHSIKKVYLNFLKRLNVFLRHGHPNPHDRHHINVPILNFENSDHKEGKHVLIALTKYEKNYSTSTYGIIDCKQGMFHQKSYSCNTHAYDITHIYSS